VRLCESSVGIMCEARTGNVLTDRKDLLRFLHAALGQDGLAAVDHTAQAFWSRDGMADEVAHDAELDIDAVYTMHVVGAEGERPADWRQGRGRRESGLADFNVREPAADLGGHAHDLLRAIAFSIVEGKLAPGGAPIELLPREPIRAVTAREFLTQGQP